MRVWNPSKPSKSMFSWINMLATSEVDQVQQPCGTNAALVGEDRYSTSVDSNIGINRSRKEVQEERDRADERNSASSKHGVGTGVGAAPYPRLARREPSGQNSGYIRNTQVPNVLDNVPPRGRCSYL